MSLEEEHSLIEELRAELLARLFHATDPDGVMSATENIRTSMETLVSLGQGSKAVTREELTRLMVGLVKVNSGVAYLNQDALAGRLSALERNFFGIRAFGADAGGRQSRVVGSGVFFLHRGEALELELSPQILLQISASPDLSLISGEIEHGGLHTEILSEGDKEAYTFSVLLLQARTEGEAFLHLPLPGPSGMRLDLAYSARPGEAYPLRLNWSITRPIK